MSVITKSIALGILALGMGSVPASVELPGGTQALVSHAGAVIGRPLTPMSYAGVARRTTRRTVAATAAATTAAQPAPVVVVVAQPTSAECVKFVDESGKTLYRCP